MQWKTYKKLSPQLKEEYNFRFNKKQFISSGLLNSFGIFILIFINFMFIAFLFLTNEKFIEYQDVVLNLFLMIRQLTSIVFIVVLIEVIYGFVSIIIGLYQFHKWKKTNNIKEEYFWTKWFIKKQ